MRVRVRCEVMPMPAALRIAPSRSLQSSHSRAPAELRVVREIHAAAASPTRGRRSTAWKSVPGPASGGAAGRADPVDGLAARVVASLITGSALWRLPRRVTSMPPQPLRRHVGHVDVEQHRLAERAARASRCDQLDAPRRSARVEMLARLAGERHRDRRDAEQVALHRGGDGARVDRVVAHVGAEVDAGDDDVGRRSRAGRSPRCARSRSACRSTK